jgi:hypothetical protein
MRNMTPAYLRMLARVQQERMSTSGEPDPRVIVPIPRKLIKEIDEFRWANRIPSRAAAIRELIKRGLKANHRPR